MPNLAAMLDHLNGASKLVRFEMPPMPTEAEVVYPVDMADVKGQEHVKRAVEVAAAGAHNVLGLWTTIQLALCAAGGAGKCTFEQNLQSPVAARLTAGTRDVTIHR